MRVLLALLGLLSFWSPQPAEAQTPAAMYCYQGPANPQWAPCSATNQLAVNASVSASITGFPTTQSTGTPISVTTGGVTGALPAGAVVVASNVGATNGAYCKLGASATTSDQLIPPNSWFAFTVGAATQLTCITSTSTTTVNMVGGSGLPTGSGGGGGSGGSVTQGTSPWVDNITQWNSVTLGSPTAWGVAPSGNVPGFNGNIVVSVLPTGAATAANQATEITSLSTIATNTGAAIPAGTAIIGKAGIDQTTDVTTNGVEIAPTAGAAAGITAVLSGAAEGSHVFKASAGNLYNAYATSTVAGYLMIFNATSAPGDGAVTPQDCVPGSLTQTGIYAATINYNPGPVEPFTTGITAVWSSTGCFTKTISATAFIHGLVK